VSLEVTTKEKVPLPVQVGAGEGVLVFDNTGMTGKIADPIVAPVQDSPTEETRPPDSDLKAALDDLILDSFNETKTTTVKRVIIATTTINSISVNPLFLFIIIFLK
jgi:hypothetical protein